MNSNFQSNFQSSTNLSFEEFFRDGLEHHKRWMIHVKNPVCKFFLLTYKKNEKLIIVNFIMASPKNSSPMDLARPLIELIDPDYYIVMGEGWAKIYNNTKEAEQSFKNLRYGDIAKMPDKVELLTALGRSKDGKHESSKVFTMKRNPNDEIIEFKEMEGGTLKTTKLP